MKIILSLPNSANPHGDCLASPLSAPPLVHAAYPPATQSPFRDQHLKDAIAANFTNLPDCAFVRLPVLLALFSCSRATIWRWVKASKIPAPKKLGARITAWNVAEIRAVLSAHMNGG